MSWPRPMTGLLLKYNKVHNDALCNLSLKLGKDIQLLWGDLATFGKRMDQLPYSVVEDYLTSLGHFDFIFIGDVFWNTGQAICRFGIEHKIPVFFLQHGQWIYIRNKKELEYYPKCTFVFGDDVGETCRSWPYGRASQVVVTGTPRYDKATFNGNGGSYIYFSPPVIEEILHGEPCGRVRLPFLNALQKMTRIDKQVPLVIQPHYREAQTEKLLELFPGAQFADPHLDSLKLICGAKKVLASRNSTIVLDAIAHQKPVVLMDFSKEDCCFFEKGYFEEFAIESSDRSELVRNLLSEHSVNKSHYLKRARKYIYLGDASTRIVDIIRTEVYNQL